MAGIDQRAALKIQLAAIAGQSRGGFYEVRFAVPGGGMAQRFRPVTERDALLAPIIGQGERSDVYIGAAPRTTRHGGASAVERFWCLWVDCDDRAAANALAVFDPAPTLVIRSGTGQNRHAYWALRGPLEPEHARRLNRRLAHAIGADMRCTDPARILRPAGTLNHKHDPPAAVAAVRVTCDLYRAEDVAGHLADPPEDLAAPPTPLRDHGDDVLRGIPADVYVPALTGRAVTRARKVQCPFHGGGEERTPSLHVYETTWACYGCDPQPGAGRDRLGGDIYTLAALLWGYALPLRGAAFLELRRRLAGELVAIGRAAA